MRLSGLGESALDKFYAPQNQISFTAGELGVGVALLVGAGALAGLFTDRPRRSPRRKTSGSVGWNALGGDSPVWQTLLLTISTGVATALITNRINNGWN